MEHQWGGQDNSNKQIQVESKAVITKNNSWSPGPSSPASARLQITFCFLLPLAHTHAEIKELKACPVWVIVLGITWIRDKSKESGSHQRGSCQEMGVLGRGYEKEGQFHLPFLLITSTCRFPIRSWLQPMPRAYFLGSKQNPSSFPLLPSLQPLTLSIPRVHFLSPSL